MVFPGLTTVENYAMLSSATEQSSVLDMIKEKITKTEIFKKKKKKSNRNIKYFLSENTKDIENRSFWFSALTFPSRYL